MPIVAEHSEPKKRRAPWWVPAVLLVVLLPAGLVAEWLGEQTEPIQIGAVTLYGPAWDHFSGASVPAYSKVWRFGEFCVVW
jgi:hypothetical protein